MVILFPVPGYVAKTIQSVQKEKMHKAGPDFITFGFYSSAFQTRTLVRMEAILTQLVLEHALRIRMKAELPDGDKKSGNSTGVSTPDSASVAGSSTAAADESIDSSSDETLQTSSETISTSPAKKGKQKAQDAKEESDSSSKSNSSADNLTGKINNLVTTDLTNITDGRDFLFVVLYIPVQIIACIFFLYQILDWSAFVGLAVMVILFPVPGYVAKMIQSVQKEKMNKVGPDLITFVCR
ncbi:hypothetical protein AZE42_02555 [Rhizopogon vesiculosus]|uniref:ABC transmembrane type-1 domain-containing protein n=1 Tax=Rhizopogon vesiculosus TaxID=180088 RepID=A0A1J8Q602_9AGAM|nr:hypothetical protein AZE42_02555 [Rhizopogon vesiculosus]